MGEISTLSELLALAALEAGGFSTYPRGSVYRPDSTAWAVLALRAAGTHPELVSRALARLAASQKADGRVCISYDETYWPTPLALLAWQGLDAYRSQRDKGSHFLLGAMGVDPPKRPDSPLGHDTSIRGWPWLAGTHSWVEPSALTVLALASEGLGSHPRVREAVRMLIDRQLPSGGWNYGNTFIFGTELPALPESTGVALTALARRVDRSLVARSLQFLARHLVSIRTPLSLAWGLLGLSAWGERPPQAATWVRESLSLGNRLGPYRTTLLGLLLLAAMAQDGREPLLLKPQS